MGDDYPDPRDVLAWAKLNGGVKAEGWSEWEKRNASVLQLDIPGKDLSWIAVDSESMSNKTAWNKKRICFRFWANRAKKQDFPTTPGQLISFLQADLLQVQSNHKSLEAKYAKVTEESCGKTVELERLVEDNTGLREANQTINKLVLDRGIEIKKLEAKLKVEKNNSAKLSSDKKEASIHEADLEKYIKYLENGGRVVANVKTPLEFGLHYGTGSSAANLLGAKPPCVGFASWFVPVGIKVRPFAHWL